MLIAACCKYCGLFERINELIDIDHLTEIIKSIELNKTLTINTKTYQDFVKLSDHTIGFEICTQRELLKAGIVGWSKFGGTILISKDMPKNYYKLEMKGE